MTPGSKHLLTPAPLYYMTQEGMYMRSCGMLLPVASLPSPYGIGAFSKEAYDFIDDLVRAGQRYWQILPLGPTSYGDSPYQSFSAFAGNPYFIDLETLTEEGLTEEEIQYMIGTAHDAGMAVMAHCNGNETCRYAIRAEVDSLEHGAFMEDETLLLLSESRTVWIPTFSPIGNLLGCGRFPDEEIRKNLDGQMKRVRKAAELGACIGLGSDAGAYLVPHGTGTLDEHAYLHQAGVPDGLLCEAEEQIRLRFKRS